MRSALICASRAPVQTGICCSCCSSLPAALPNSSSGGRGQCCSFPAAISNTVLWEGQGKQQPPCSSRRSWGPGSGAVLGDRDRDSDGNGGADGGEDWEAPGGRARAEGSESLMGLDSPGFGRTDRKDGKVGLAAQGRDQRLGSCLG